MRHSIGKRFLSLSLSVLLLFSFGSLALAEVAYGSQAGFVKNLQSAESMIEVTVKSVSMFRYPKLGPDETIDNEDFNPFDVTVSVDKNLYGKPIAEKELELILNLGWEVKVEAGKRYIIALAKNDPVDRKRLADSDSVFDYDPGEYGSCGILERNEDGSLWGLGAMEKYHFASYADVIDQMEGRAPSSPELGATEPVLYYNGQLIQRAYVTKAATVYESRDGNSKKLIALQPYDFVLQVGDTDLIYGKTWDKVLLANGELGFVPGDRLGKLPHSVNKDSNTLVKVAQDMPLYDATGKALSVGRLVKGTAAVLQDSPPYEEALAVKYLAMSAGMQRECLVEKWDWERMDRPKELRVTSGFRDFSADGYWEDDVPLPCMDDGQYRMCIAKEKTTLYASASRKSDVLGSVPKSGLFMEVEVNRATNTEKTKWISLLYQGKVVYAPAAQVQAQGKTMNGPTVYDVKKNAYVYRYDGNDFQMVKEAVVYDGFTLMVGGEAKVNGKIYRELIGNGENMFWVRVN